MPMPRVWGLETQHLMGEGVEKSSLFLHKVHGPLGPPLYAVGEGYPITLNPSLTTCVACA